MLIRRQKFLFRPALVLAWIVMTTGITLAQLPPARTLPIRAGSSIAKSTQLTSPSGNHKLIFAADGNLVVTTKADGFVWGYNDLTTRYSETDLFEFDNNGVLVAYDKGRATLWSAPRGGAGATLNLTFRGALQVAAANGTIVWSSDGVHTASIDVFGTKAALAEDASQLSSEPGWQQCWIMQDPAIKIFATSRVSKSAINAVANVYAEMTRRLNPIYPRKKFDGFKVYITNGESNEALKTLNTVGTMWSDGTGPMSRQVLRGGATKRYLWITEQMICKAGVKTLETIGKTDNSLRTFDQVIHEFAHSIDMNFIAEDIIAAFNGPIGPVEGFAGAVQAWFGAPARPIPTHQKNRLSKIFTSRALFSPDGYGKDVLDSPAAAGGLSVADLKRMGKPLRYKGVWDWNDVNKSQIELDPTKPEVKYAYQHGDASPGVYSLPYTLVDNEKGNAVLSFSLPDGNQVQFEWADRDSIKGKFWLAGVPKTAATATQTTMNRVGGPGKSVAAHDSSWEVWLTLVNSENESYLVTHESKGAKVGEYYLAGNEERKKNGGYGSRFVTMPSPSLGLNRPVMRTSGGGDFLRTVCRYGDTLRVQKVGDTGGSKTWTVTAQNVSGSRNYRLQSGDTIKLSEMSFNPRTSL